jgi:predicted RNA binding protein YcfA (HicA-like mRNA interferase family)
MSKSDKILEKMRLNPRDWRIEQLKSLAEAHGVDYRQHGTSHVIFRHSNGAKLTVPAHKPIAPEYVKKFLRLITQAKIE